MRRLVHTGVALVLTATAWLGADGLIQVQELEHGVSPADVDRGGEIFLSSCAVCHGPDGDLISGVDLGSGTFRRGSTDQELIAIIQRGLPATLMPPSALNDADAARVVAYLRGLPAMRRSSGGATVRGNAVNGKAIYEGKGRCQECHVVNGAGGFLGPDLSSMGLSRRPADLYRSVVEPSAEIRTGNLTAKVIQRDGATLVGRLLNHDTYTLQVIDARGNLFSVDKTAVSAWEIPTESSMPSYKGTLTGGEIADVVTYLVTLQAPVPGGAGRGRGAGGGARAGAPGAAGTQQAPPPGRGR
jgi:putative heme-binding domain-containing protein